MENPYLDLRRYYNMDKLRMNCSSVNLSENSNLRLSGIRNTNENIKLLEDLTYRVIMDEIRIKGKSSVSYTFGSDDITNFRGKFPDSFIYSLDYSVDKDYFYWSKNLWDLSYFTRYPVYLESLIKRLNESGLYTRLKPGKDSTVSLNRPTIVLESSTSFLPEYDRPKSLSSKVINLIFNIIFKKNKIKSNKDIRTTLIESGYKSEMVDKVIDEVMSELK